MTFRSIFSLACCAAALLSPASAAPRPGDAKLRDDLDVAYNTWRLHLLRGNYDGWRATTSAYRQVKVRNLAVSEKRPFPASLFRQPMAPPRARSADVRRFRRKRPHGRSHLLRQGGSGAGPGTH